MPGEVKDRSVAFQRHAVHRPLPPHNKWKRIFACHQVREGEFSGNAVAIKVCPLPLLTHRAVTKGLTHHRMQLSCKEVMLALSDPKSIRSLQVSDLTLCVPSSTQSSKTPRDVTSLRRVDCARPKPPSCAPSTTLTSYDSMASASTILPSAVLATI